MEYSEAETDWRLQRLFSESSSQVALTEFHVNAAGPNTRMQGYALSLRGRYPAVIAMIELALNSNAAIALQELSCSVVLNAAGQVDCTLSLQRAIDAGVAP